MFCPSRVLFPEILALHAKWQPRKAAIIHPTGTSTWQEFGDATSKIGSGLRALGLSQGDRVGLVMGNELATVELIFGLMCAGLVAVPINVSVSDVAMAGKLLNRRRDRLSIRFH